MTKFYRGKKNLQKRGTKHILFIIIIVILIITRLVSTALGAGGPLDGGGPLHRAGQGRWRSDVLHVVGQAKLIEAPRGVSAPRRLVGRALGVRAVGVAQHPCGRSLVPLDPCIVVTDDILMVKAREQRHFAFDPSELLTGWVDLNTLHSIVTTIEFVLDLEVQERERVTQWTG